MGAKITLMGPEWISLDGSLPKVQEPCYFLDRENVFRGVMDESGDVYEILDNDTNDVGSLYSKSQFSLSMLSDSAANDNATTSRSENLGTGPRRTIFPSALTRL